MKHIIAISLGLYLTYKGITGLANTQIESEWLTLWLIVILGATAGIIYHWYLENWRL
jgi:hypothetical protein